MKQTLSKSGLVALFVYLGGCATAPPEALEETEPVDRNEKITHSLSEKRIPSVHAPQSTLTPEDSPHREDLRKYARHTLDYVHYVTTLPTFQDHENEWKNQLIDAIAYSKCIEDQTYDSSPYHLDVQKPSMARDFMILQRRLYHLVPEEERGSKIIRDYTLAGNLMHDAIEAIEEGQGYYSEKNECTHLME